MALDLTQLLTEMSIRNLPALAKRGLRARLTASQRAHGYTLVYLKICIVYNPM
jgi:hypothetical protein